MFGNKDGKPVTIVITAHTYVAGDLKLQGAVLKDVPADLAMELASCGKARIATKDDLSAAKASAAKEDKVAA